MKRKKDGSYVIPAAAWELSAHDHYRTAAELQGVATFCYAVFKGQADGSALSPDALLTVLPEWMTMGRVRAESYVHANVAVEDRQSLQAEMLCMAVWLGRLADGHEGEASKAMERARGTRRGRPKAATLNALATPASTGGKPTVARGRKPLIPFSDETLLQMVKRGRDDLSDPTERTTLESVVRFSLEEQGKNQARPTVDRLVKNLQRRVSDKRRRVRIAAGK